MMHDSNEKSVKKAEGLVNRVLRRRGVLTAAWAAAAAVVFKKTEAPVHADGTQGTPLTIGVLNTETAGTYLRWAGSPSSTVMLLGNDSLFVPTDSAFAAATGGWAAGSGGTFAGVPNGVYGYTARTGGSGVIGANDSTGPGVRGLAVAGGPGVLGESWATGSGVRGEIPSTNGSNAIAIYGANNSPYAGASPGAGGFGVYGLSARGHGLVGATAAAGAAAVVGATNGVAGAYAGAFYGPLIVSGALTVFGAKSAAVPHHDGSYRRVYCVESPDSWFEDFGKGRLECGRADITIDPDFAAIVDLQDYHVFVTQYGGHHDLSVMDQTAHGFRVEAKDATATGTFSWRIVARRKDIAGPRLEHVPAPPEFSVPSIPESGAASPAGPQLQKRG
jgi:hypothetical protein